MQQMLVIYAGPGHRGILLSSREPGAPGQEVDGGSLSSSSWTAQQAEVTQALTRLHSARDHTALNAYCSVLVNHGWTQPTIAEILQTSQQNVAQKVRRGRSWLDQYQPSFEQLYPQLPVVPGPGRAATTSAHRKTPSKTPALDAAQIRQDAAERVDAELREAAASTSADHSDAVLRHTARLIQEAEAAKDAAAAERAIMAWSLICFQGRAGIAQAGYWSPSQFTRARNEALGITSEDFAQLNLQDLAALASSRGIEPQDDAEQRFMDASRRILAIAAAIQRAREHRDRAIVALAGADGGRNVGVRHVARLAGITPGAVTQIIARQRA